MKILLVCALLALLVGQSLASLTGLYRFTSTITEGVSSKPYLRLSSKVLVTPVAGEEQYSLKIVELALSVNEESVPVQSLDLPFQFIRSSDGLIRTVLVHPEESLDTKNLKKFITESFQVSLSSRPTEVEEAGFNGIRNVHYANVYADARRIMKKGTYTLSDFVSFPAGSNMEKSITSITSKKMTSMNAQDKSLISAKTTFEIVSLKDTKDIKFITESALQFETADIQTTQVVDEVDWQSETLLHELDSKVRIATLKSQLPSVATLAEQLQENGSKASMARGKLVWLMNNDEESLQQGLELLSKALASPLDKQARVLSTLARVRSTQAQEILVQEITNAAGDATKLKLILKSLTSLDHPESASLLVSALQKVQVPAVLQPLVDLTIGHIAKYLPAAEASEVLVAFINQLAQAQEEPEKIQLLHILGNAGENAPLDVITSFLNDPSPVVRAAALTNLRNHLQLEKVQDKVASLLSNQENLTQGLLNSFVGALKENSKKHNALNDRFASFLSSLVAQAPKSEAVSNLQSFLEGHGIAVKSFSIAPAKSESEIWNDTSDPIFNLVAPAAQRDEDVLRYPDNSAYIFGSQFGPRFANLKVAGGVFSGTNGDGCLAGNFKIFDKLYTDVEVLGDVTVLADLQLYVLTFGGKFDSRIYAIINGNTVIDIILSSECTEEDIPIFDGDISIIDYETEFPVGPANGVAFIQVSAGLNFAAGYKICLLVLAPYVEIFLTGQVDLTASAGVTITALGLVRGGLEADAYLNYIVGPDTQLGSRNSSAGVVCQACIGVYYGYQDQTVYTGLWFQRREGLSWGEKQLIPLLDYVYPAVPFPSPLVETCSETSMEAEPSKEGILKH